MKDLLLSFGRNNSVFFPKGQRIDFFRFLNNEIPYFFEVLLIVASVATALTRAGISRLEANTVKSQTFGLFAIATIFLLAAFMDFFLFFGRSVSIGLLLGIRVLIFFFRVRSGDGFTQIYFLVEFSHVHDTVEVFLLLLVKIPLLIVWYICFLEEVLTVHDYGVSLSHIVVVGKNRQSFKRKIVVHFSFSAYFFDEVDGVPP